MEENRLKPMPANYDHALFMEIYDATKALRKKLSSQIDHRRFGVDNREIQSWFDVKFLHAFTRYFGEKSPNLLKAHIIQSLQFFKNRILRHSYSLKNSVNNNCIDVTELYDLQETTINWQYDEKEFFLGLALEFLKNHLSEQAFIVLNIELNPPLYILERLGDASTTKIPSSLIGDYLGLEENKDSISKVNAWRREVKSAMLEAKEYFRDKEIV